MAADPKRVRDLFLAAAELAAPDRAAYLSVNDDGDAELRAAIERLLAAHEDPASLLNRPAPGMPTAEYAPIAETVGTKIGPYKLMEQIGEGGFGLVFVAEQIEPVRRKVALKVIKPGMDSGQVMARFQAERQALAMMDHPNIARVLDAGATDTGRPYFVMELVRGIPITAYCDQNHLPPRERLELFVSVCHAIQHAHQKGVIHRDIKPSNVLVTSHDGMPVAKVIDFGVAKAIHQPLTDRTIYTNFAQMIGTPLYMSPEQAEMSGLDIDTRSDIYSLGVLLYELLTGSTPLAKKSVATAAYDEIRRLIREEEPPRPSTRLSSSDSLASIAAQRHTEPAKLSKLVAGDLDWITMKALEKDRTRRYETANGLARDIQRYLADEVVEAQPPSAGYRLKKFVRRHKGQVIAASVVLVALLVGIVGATLGLIEARRQEQEARYEADKARKARDFLVSIFRIKDIQAGNTTTARQILNQAEQRIPIEFAEQPELRDELLAAIGDVNRTLDRTIPAAMVLEARGAIQLHSARGGSARPVPQTLLYPDDRLTLAAEAQAQLVFLSDLHKERLQPGREATIGRKSCSPADAVQERDDSILMTFVRLPKETFYMGWDGRPGSAKKREIAEDFEIAVHDVTQGQWEAIMGSNPSWFSRKGGGRGNVLAISDEELKLFPVESVSRDDAQVFLKKLNEKEAGRGYWYRLPSEAEWEYACRGGATSEEECLYLFYFDKPTNDISSEQANFNGNWPFGSAPKGPYLERTTRVGAYPSNKLGLCDMHGNVEQRCADDRIQNRVYRGGSWRDSGTDCRAAIHFWGPPTDRFHSIGLRLARVPVR